jgi:superfamily II DNA/RNA helicase
MQVIVFCTTAKVTSLVAELLSELKLNVREIHSRKPQSYRTRISKEFKESKGLILVSSDVSARGVDYPNVTLVVQVNTSCTDFWPCLFYRWFQFWGFHTFICSLW